jgi:hypothetical protein
MCYSYLTYLSCTDCGETIPGSHGYYNVPTHSPACIPDRSGRYEVRDPPEHAWANETVNRAGMASGCLYCSMDTYREEKREAREKAKA